MNGISTIPCLNQNSTIFKTINGDLTLFNKTLIATKDNLRSLETVNATVYNKHGVFNLDGLTTSATKSVSSFTKLSNAFKVYNGNLSKSTQLQSAYIKAVGNQNSALGNYLAGLNGAKASMSGYIKSLVAAKAASIGLQVASIALNTAITMGVSLAISALVSQISKWIHAQEEARQKSVELTNSYKEQQSSLDSQIEKYKELKETLDKGNLSTDESRSIKEQLLEIQQSLIDSYGDEASNIDLVNGKYREQLGLLSELSKEKATDYVTENRDVFADAKEALEKIRTYNLGTVTSWNTYVPETEEQKRLIEYLETYSDLLDLTYSGASGHGVTATSVNLSVKADVENADEIMHQLAEDLEKYGKDNNIDVSGLLEGISGQLKKTWTDELTEYKTVYDEFMKAEIVRNDTLRPLYQESIKAVEDYNNALSTGEGVEEAKANLDSVQQSVQNATGELEGSQDVFDGIYDGINKDAEAAYNLGQAFKNDKTVQEYAEQLRGLTDIDLKAINFDDTVEQPGEKAFTALMDYLGYTQEEAQKLIDKLVELEYVQGEVQESAPETTFNKSDMISSINELSEGFEEIDKIFSSISDEDPFDFKLLDDKAFKEAFSGLDSYASFIETITSNSDDIEACKTSFNGLIDEWIMSTGVLDNVNESTAQLATSMLNMYGIQNAEEIVQARLKANTDELALSQKYLAETGKELESATDDERLAFLAEQVAAEECGKELALLELKKQLVNGTLLDTQDDINNVLALAEAAGISAEAISVLATAKANFDNAMKSGDAGLIGASAGELERAQQKIKDLIASAGTSDYTGGNNSNKSSGGSSSDKWLQEYKDAMSILKDQLDQGLITQTQFYKKSQDLMDKYLKDTPAHVKKYSKEISEAEKDIRNGLTSMFEGIISDLNSDLDNMQSSFSSIANAIEEYNESGALSIDTVQELLKLEPKYLSMLFDENGALQLNQESYERLARAKMEEMKIGLAMEMANTINNLETEAQAIEFVTQMNRELIGSNLSAAESYLKLAVAAAKARSAQTGKVIYSQAADLGLKAYQNQARLIDMTSYSFYSLGGSSTSSRKEEKL